MLYRIPFLDWGDAKWPQNMGRRIFASHLIPEMLPPQIWEKRAKIIHILRDPRDSAVSFYHYLHRYDFFTEYYKNWDNYFEKHFSCNSFYGSWFDFVKSWKQQENGSNVHFLSYEELKKDPKLSIANLAKFLEKPITEEQLDFIHKQTTFKAMKANPACNYENMENSDTSSFMRKGKVGDWKNKFTDTQEERFMQMYRQEDKDGDLGTFLRKHGIQIE